MNRKGIKHIKLYHSHVCKVFSYFNSNTCLTHNDKSLHIAGACAANTGNPKSKELDQSPHNAQSPTHPPHGLATSPIPAGEELECSLRTGHTGGGAQGSELQDTACKRTLAKMQGKHLLILTVGPDQSALSEASTQDLPSAPRPPSQQWACSRRPSDV